ncbi:hypothetical protein [Rhizobium rhizogenes]|uniref:hypothetical protein n=1 Tax=Rhizobium rhizogenes TaxID=359 RepID=UPI001574ADF4|nr:hypothetical protein [Rhizobium rhizogenes]NTF64967.1 hypothetical protein [Rhizobium rhizogenes]NTG96315.1 hypothetical protein [Rhizobium rhizogenes]
MSGPKVVRIVTREEVIAICEGHIAVLASAFERWQRVGKRNDVIDADDLRRAENRITAMRDLLAKDQFTEVQKQAPEETAFLKADMERRIECAVDKATQERNENRRRLRAAGSVAQALSSKGLGVPPALLQPEAHSQDELQSALSQAFALLVSSAEKPETTDRQRELAAKLGDGEKQATLADWLATQAATIDGDPALAALERQFEHLRALDPNRAKPIGDRLEQVSGDTSSRRTLLIDSLTLDVAEALRAALAEANKIEKLRAIEAQLKNFQIPSVATQLSEISRLLAASPTLSEISALTTAAGAVLEAALTEQAEVDRRRAVLDGLAELGYEVKEGMQTAWVENGRVILKSKKSLGYGIEIGGDPSNNMQVRTVAFANPEDPRDAVADVSAETEFCGDFSALQAKIAVSGGELSITKALGVGATPVKRVSATQEAEVADILARSGPVTLQRR